MLPQTFTLLQTPEKLTSIDTTNLLAVVTNIIISEGLIPNQVAYIISWLLKVYRNNESTNEQRDTVADSLVELIKEEVSYATILS